MARICHPARVMLNIFGHSMLHSGVEWPTEHPSDSDDLCWSGIQSWITFHRLRDCRSYRWGWPLPRFTCLGLWAGSLGQFWGHPMNSRRWAMFPPSWHPRASPSAPTAHTSEPLGENTAMDTELEKPPQHCWYQRIHCNGLDCLIEWLVCNGLVCS